ncbi:MAG: dual specificity protein phosphatase family protein [Desulforhopalus sp.]
MSEYLLTWITKNLAVGHAPMSYAELDNIKAQGIDAIVNLCQEFCDLHELEEKSGFEVFYLPIPDENAPEMAEMEKGLEWLDEAIYLGKKVLIHCHHGVGRTGTFVTAYLLRRGFGLKKAGKMLRATKANPTNFSQWWLLRKFGKKERQLTLGEPTPENRNSADLSDFYTRYERLLEKIDTLTTPPSPDCCSKKGSEPCNRTFTLELIEALYLNNKININLSAEQRKAVIKLANSIDSQPRRKTAEVGPTDITDNSESGNGCPLHQNNTCLLHQSRPIHCRLKGFAPDSETLIEIQEELAQLSREVFQALFGQEAEQSPPVVNFSDSISGKFIQNYFQYLTARKSSDERS